LKKMKGGPLPGRGLVLMNVPKPAVEASLNVMPPPPEPLPFVPLLLTKVALPALEVPKNCVTLPPSPLTGLSLLVKTVRLPAVAPFVNCISLCLPVVLTAVTKFCTVPELFVIPTPLIVRTNLARAVTLNAFAFALKTMPSTSVFAEIETAVRLLVANVAVSEGALGTVGGIQFVAVFQSPEFGLVFHVALPATLF